MNITQTAPRNRLLQCLAFSLVAHTAALTWFYYHPMILQNSFKSLFGMTVAEPTPLENEDSALLHKNQLLDEVFQKIVVLSPHYQKPYDLIELPQGISLAPTQEEVEANPSATLKNPHFPENLDRFAASAENPVVEEDAFVMVSPPEQGAPIASQLQFDTEISLQAPLGILPFSGHVADIDRVMPGDFPLAPTYESADSIALSPPEFSSDELSIKADLQTMAQYPTAADLSVESEQTRPALLVPKALAAFLGKRQVPMENFAGPDEYDFPASEYAAEWNDDFDVDITFLPTPEGKGYIFSVALSSNADISSHSLKQNLYFILDRSNSIQKHRFGVFKRAVLKALSSMNQGDTFNILVMDKKIVQFSPENRPVSLKSIHAAEEFLDKQEAGGFFNGADVYAQLEKILPSIPENEEMHTAILLTDGKSNLNAEKKRASLKKWMEKNEGKLSVYACAIGSDNDLLTLDMLCHFSGGTLLYSDTHASFPRKLAKLVLDLKDPVAKDLRITAIPHNPQSQIEFFPASSHLSSLYSHQPYVLVGQIDNPCSFDLIIQGRHLDEWIAIKKNVSFIEGRKGDSKLEKLWDAEHANICYAKFLKEGKPAHLKEAKQILKKSRTEVAFE